MSRKSPRRFAIAEHDHDAEAAQVDSPGEALDLSGGVRVLVDEQRLSLQIVEDLRTANPGGDAPGGVTQRLRRIGARKDDRDAFRRG
ncbi:hypothetical protein BH18ACT13_BH18ACT13_10960 [soil metagenome]